MLLLHPQRHLLHLLLLHVHVLQVLLFIEARVLQPPTPLVHNWTSRGNCPLCAKLLLLWPAVWRLRLLRHCLLLLL
jgi:hypothetical protein